MFCAVCICRAGLNQLYNIYGVHSTSSVLGRELTKNSVIYIGLAKVLYIWRVYGIFGRKFTNCTVIYGAYIRFWPTPHTRRKYTILANPAHARTCLSYVHIP
jgi:hypothetical protein